MNLAEVVRDRREQLGLTLRDAAAQSGGLVSSTTLHAIERGDAGVSSERVIQGIATALDLSESKVRRAAGLSAQTLPPLELPDRAQLLNARERKLVLQLIDTLLAARRS